VAESPCRDRLALGGLIAEGGRILGVDNMLDCSELDAGLSPALGSLKPELGGFSPELGGLSLEMGGLSIGVPTFLGEVPPVEKELGPVVFRLLAIDFLGGFLVLWIDELRASLALTVPTSGLVGFEIAAVRGFAEKSLGLT